MEGHHETRTRFFHKTRFSEMKKKHSSWLDSKLPAFLGRIESFMRILTDISAKLAFPTMHLKNATKYAEYPKNVARSLWSKLPQHG